MNTVATKYKYFAAANGYSGFRSYFSDVFKREKYSKVYILKGGPGTGKSSFMKKVLNAFSDKEINSEAIFCSSDPRSLDGVILEKDGKKIAVLDGTAPHSTDPVFPGAVDKIINLGECWEQKLLENNRDFIVKSGIRKQESYRNAYDYLHLCGGLTKLVDEELKRSYNKSDDSAIFEITHAIPMGEGSVETRLITSFGKEGFGRLNTATNIAENVIYAVGVYGSEYIFTEHLISVLKHKKIDYWHFPSALDGSKTYGVYIPFNKTAIVADNGVKGEGKIIDTSRFVDIANRESLRNKLEFLWKEREVLLWNSVDEFKKASDEHFALEKIYTAAMDFKKANTIFDAALKEIGETLSVSPKH